MTTLQFGYSLLLNCLFIFVYRNLTPITQSLLNIKYRSYYRYERYFFDKYRKGITNKVILYIHFKVIL